MHEVISCMEFIKSDQFMEVLGEAHEIALDNDRVTNHVLTTEDIKEFCKDIKVLGKAELKTLIQWRKKLNAQFKKEDGENNVEDVEMKQIDEDSEDDEETRLLKHVQQMNADAMQELKRVKRKKLKQLRKTRDALNLKMVIKGDEGIVQEDKDVFQLDKIESMKRKLTEGEELSEDELEEIDDMGIAISKKSSKEGGSSESESEDPDEDMEWEEEQEEGVDSDKIMTKLGTGRDRKREKAASWFSRTTLANQASIEDDLYEEVPSLKKVRSEVNLDLKIKRKNDKTAAKRKRGEGELDSSDDEYDNVVETERQKYIDQIEKELDEIRAEKEARKPQIKQGEWVVFSSAYVHRI